MHQTADNTGGVRIVALSVGNTRMTFAPCAGREVGTAHTMGVDDLEAAAGAIAEAVAQTDAEAVVVATGRCSSCPAVEPREQSTRVASAAAPPNRAHARCRQRRWG